MKLPDLLASSLLTSTLLALPAAHAADSECKVVSGPQTAALVELYTSEGCSSCPPADRHLSQFRATPAQQVVPLSLHVDYWDYIGWRDRFASADFGRRQSWLVAANRRRTVYTPQFFVGGRELINWRGGLTGAIDRINDTPARARIELAATGVGPRELQLRASARETPSAAATDPLVLFVALTENRLSSQVRAGENSGVTLQHDYVVRRWLGPYPLKGGVAEASPRVKLDADSRSDALTLVGFVQNTVTGEVLQAVGTGSCRFAL